MAGLPMRPGAPPNGGPPPMPQPGMGAPQPGMPPGGAPPPGGPPGQPPGGLAGAMSPHPPHQDVFQDISDAMPPEFQILDAAQRMIETAIGTGGFYKMPDVLAHVRECSKTLKKIVTVYAQKSEGELSPPESSQADAIAGDVEDLPQTEE